MTKIGNRGVYCGVYMGPKPNELLLLYSLHTQTTFCGYFAIFFVIYTMKIKKTKTKRGSILFNRRYTISIIMYQLYKKEFGLLAGRDIKCRLSHPAKTKVVVANKSF